MSSEDDQKEFERVIAALQDQYRKGEYRTDKREIPDHMLHLADQDKALSDQNMAAGLRMTQVLLRQGYDSVDLWWQLMCWMQGNSRYALASTLCAALIRLAGREGVTFSPDE